MDSRVAVDTAKHPPSFFTAPTIRRHEEVKEREEKELKSPAQPSASVSEGVSAVSVNTLEREASTERRRCCAETKRNCYRLCTVVCGGLAYWLFDKFVGNKVPA